MRYEAAGAVLERIASDADVQTRSALLTVSAEMRANAQRWWEAALA